MWECQWPSAVRSMEKILNVYKNTVIVVLYVWPLLGTWLNTQYCDYIQVTLLCTCFYSFAGWEIWIQQCNNLIVDRKPWILRTWHTVIGEGSNPALGREFVDFIIMTFYGALATVGYQKVLWGCLGSPFVFLYYDFQSLRVNWWSAVVYSLG